MDRDGVINRNPPPHEYVTRPEDFHLLPGVVPALKTLSSHGYRLIIVTNQQGIAKQCLTQATLEAIHAKMTEELGREGVAVTDIFVCPHAAVAACGCRKPRPGLLLAAAAKHSIPLAETFFVGNSTVDVEAGKAAGMKTILVGASLEDRNGGPQPDHRVENLEEAVLRVLPPE